MSVNTKDTFKHPLIGKWISDKEQTFEWLKENRCRSNDQIKKLESKNIYGKLILEFTNDKCISYYDDEINEMPFEIIGIESNTIAHVAVDPISGEREIRLILIEDENSFSVYQDDFDMREFFKRME